MSDSRSAARVLAKNSDRVKQIVEVFAKYGFASWVAAGAPATIAKAVQRSSDQDLVEMTDGERIRTICLELGTTFIKVGQMLSTRKDIVGEEIATALGTLQSDVPPDPPEDIAATILAELGKPPQEIFGDFDLIPMGSASVAQVHLAHLPDGTDVVVKVQHTGVADLIATDMEIMAALAQLAEANNPELAIYRPAAMVQQFRQSLLAEVDFRREAASLAEFRKNFKNEPDVVIPEPFPDFSSKRVLTMSRLDGPTLAQDMDNLGDRLTPFVHRGADIYIEMIFRDSFFHADPHPGNIVVLGDSIGLIDFGKVGRIDDDTQEVIDDLAISLMGNDLDGLVAAVLQLCGTPSKLDRTALRQDLSDWISQYGQAGAGNVDIAAASEDASAIMRSHRLYMPPAVALLMRTLTVLQGMLVETKVDLRIADVLQPHLTMIAAKRFAPERLAKKVARTARGWEQLSDTLPTDVTEILQGIRLGTIEVPLRLENMDRNVNRMVYSIIAAALFQGSSRLWTAKVPPTYRGVSLPGAIGTVSAGYFAIRLLRTSRRSGGIG